MFLSSKLNNKGMTLVELLAVIVILSIISMIAVVNVSQVIQKSRDQAFVSSAIKFSESARMYLHATDLHEDVPPNRIEYRTLYHAGYIEKLRDPDTGEVIEPNEEEAGSYAVFSNKKITPVCYRGVNRNLCSKEDGTEYPIPIEDLSIDLINKNN